MHAIEEALKSGLAAFMPVYHDEYGNCTEIILDSGKQFVYKKTCKATLNNIMKIFAVDLSALRERYRTVLNRKNQIPLPLSFNLTLIPIKVRCRPLGKHDGAHGFINLEAIDDVKPVDNNSTIILKNGKEITAYASENTVRNYIRDADYVKKHFLYILFKGLKNMPHSDLLLNFLTNIDGSAQGFNPYVYSIMHK